MRHSNAGSADANKPFVSGSIGSERWPSGLRRWFAKPASYSVKYLQNTNLTARNKRFHATRIVAFGARSDMFVGHARGTRPPCGKPLKRHKALLPISQSQPRTPVA